MSSNSKLTTEQKAERKAMMADLPKGSEMTMTPDGVTVLIVPDGAVNLMATAIASPDEQKMRRKVGQYHALVRWNAGCAIPVPIEFGLDQAAEVFGGIEYDEVAQEFVIFTKE